MEEKDLVLGYRLRDTVSGWVGIADAKTEWLNGCIRVSLSALDADKGKPVGYVFDIQQLEFVDMGVVTQFPAAKLDDPNAKKKKKKRERLLSGCSTGGAGRPDMPREGH